MSEIKINLTDKNNVLTGEIHGSTGNALIASLTSEPETIEEMKIALERFEPSASGWTPIGWLKSLAFERPEHFVYYLDTEPYDAGVLVIDLAGKTIACESTYSSYSRNGTIRVADERADDPESFDLPYRLSDDWKIVRSIAEYHGIAGQRREKRSKIVRVDARAVLYGRPLIEFIVNEMRNAADSADQEWFTEIHAKWLMTPRKDLSGETPREILLDKCEFIDFDLHSRGLQWSVTKRRPPDLPRSAEAYKFSGFGTNEIVVYYDLFRYLLGECRQMLAAAGVSALENQIESLTNKKSAWLSSPNPEFSGRVPSEIIESERRRRNLTVSPEECLIDEDCPICIEMAEIFDTPTFWGLDGCNMDDRFEFSFCRTIEQWEAEQRRFEQFNREFAARYIEGDEQTVFDEDILM